MKYNGEQRKIIKEKEQQLHGELQKSVWSIIRNNGDMRLVTIATMLGRRNDSVYTTCKKLIEYDLIELKSRGVYGVSQSILGGSK